MFNSFYQLKQYFQSVAHVRQIGGQQEMYLRMTQKRAKIWIAEMVSERSTKLKLHIEKGPTTRVLNYGRNLSKLILVLVAVCCDNKTDEYGWKFNGLMKCYKPDYSEYFFILFIFILLYEILVSLTT